MYKSALLLVLFVFWKTAGASNESSPANKISLHSTILQEIRNVYIYLPPDYEGSDSLFPVIYVTDGDIHRLRAIAGVVEGLSTATLENQMRQAVIVAIPNTNRSRDLTPSVLPEWTFENRKLDTFEQSGGAKQFRDFLKTELVPYIERRYRVSTERILVGESFGGLFAADTLLQQPDLFSGYLIIDPTALWDDNYLNRQYELKKETVLNTSPLIYFAFANNSHLGKIGLTNRKWGEQFASALKAASSNPALVSHRYFEDETHGTVAFLAWYHGLRALLPAE